MPRDLVDTATAGEAVGRSAWTIGQWVRDGRLCAYGTARRRRVSLGEVLELARVLGVSSPYGL
ncbi:MULTISPECIES: hypothetical protein [Brachybacterium]|uniref:Helix-turn-helix domain-containing protein n=1 Tax=Brachybacterium kimchii TaxID=2942909 RepID=A0ABY4N4H7_9MICO|nr:hypothetical protein [Brachybacterium kimchii]UQN29458.1 hypothetical protein M4486_17765 [Brachybacterium kimchii]